MGNWGVDKKELIQKLTECLDNIEGDFNSDDLSKALNFMQHYAPTSDSCDEKYTEWNRKLKEIFGED